jgi:hypothetical protein
MKRIIFCSLSLFLAVPAIACIGESASELKTRYGPEKDSYASQDARVVWNTYLHNGLRIEVVILDGISQSEKVINWKFDNVGDPIEIKNITDAQCQEFLRTNSIGAKWREFPWERAEARKLEKLWISENQKSPFKALYAFVITESKFDVPPYKSFEVRTQAYVDYLREERKNNPLYRAGLIFS